MAISCTECGGALDRERLKEYIDETLIPDGPGVMILNAVDQYTCQDCGETSTQIVDLPGLIAAVAVSRATTPRLFSSAELTFLRKAIRMTAKALAKNVGVSEATMSRWKDQAIPGPADKLLRMIVCEKLGDQAPCIPFDILELCEMQIAPVTETKPYILGPFYRARVVHDRHDRRPIPRECWDHDRSAAA